MTGIRDWIPEAHTYRSELTKEDIVKCMESLKDWSYPKQPILLMGLTTSLLWNFSAELFDAGIYLKYYIATFKKNKTIYISLLEKHGPYKLIIHPSKKFKYELFKGTVKIGDYNNVLSLVEKITYDTK